MIISLAQIEERKAVLENAKVKLKEYFIGIDPIIESLLDYIQVWYLVPDVLTRPIIINLWGMTGVGKTDLVRKLVKHLNFQDRFAEVELSNIDGTSWISSVADVLERNNINDDKPSIILFDEIQRFNTIDAEGKILPQTKFMDFWELLSDGRLAKKEKDDLDYYLSNFLFQSKDIQKRKQRGEEGLDENPMVDWWQMQSLKKMLQIETDSTDFSELSQKEMIDMIVKAKTKKQIYEPVDHSKTLIIISGNLDEAFTMAYQTSEADVDADIFHAYTTKVTLVDVKNALSQKFRPEQVARFGNIHLIYRSLRKHDFEELISREVQRVIDTTKSKFGIELAVDKSVEELIYRNGVFPVQGVRPVFSSVVDILESNLSNLLFKALMTAQTTIHLAYHTEESYLAAKVGEEDIMIPYTGRIDKIRDSNEIDAIANISVHEAGHAVVYMLLFGLAPLQLKSKVASSYSGGFTFPHLLHENRENLIKKIKIFLAGGLAEEMMFGKNNASIGRINDREQATTIVIDFIRKYGFDEEFQANYTLEGAYYMDKSRATDTDIEKMMARMVADTKEHLSEYKALLKELSVELCLKGTLEATEIAALAQKHALNVLIKEEGFLNINEYYKLLKS